ncbi:MAG: geranylgeranylglyceryl/heptaprenylglyceryl phosphate synthase [Bacteroidales bacterium]|nr:geranylgeranylglyceryl/heptaprenylglyceryl phosphate synthase [Bacteroidales bacterium]
MIYKNICDKIKNNKKQLAVLIDPDKYNENTIKPLVKILSNVNIDLIFIGGSLISKEFGDIIKHIKEKCSVPVIIFPGSLLQISNDADGILFLSLISGRNPEYLIGNHVVAAPLLKKSKLEILPTGYILIESGNLTSVEYISNTLPIPANKVDIAVATAIAGEMLGNKLIYLEAGSGAKYYVNKNIISEVKNNINIPLIVGGGIKTNEEISEVCKAGADIVVIGTAIEKEHGLLKGFSEIVHSFNY